MILALDVLRSCGALKAQELVVVPLPEHLTDTLKVWRWFRPAVGNLGPLRKSYSNSFKLQNPGSWNASPGRVLPWAQRRDRFDTGLLLLISSLGRCHRQPLSSQLSMWQRFLLQHSGSSFFRSHVTTNNLMDTFSGQLIWRGRSIEIRCNPRRSDEKLQK